MWGLHFSVKKKGKFDIARNELLMWPAMLLCCVLLVTNVRALAPAPDVESRVIASIKNVASERSFGALGEFGAATGDLFVSKLTPETVEDVTRFWQDGAAATARDATRVQRWRLREARAAGAFAALAAATFPWTPLLLPLIDEALEDTAQDTYVPSSFSAARRGAMRRLAGGAEFRADEGTPRDAEESVKFFRDGASLAARDIRRGTLISEEDSWAVWGRFLALAFSTFPLTPLLLPSIDERRDGPRSDYVPSPFRGRLRAVERLRLRDAARYGDPIATLRRVAGEDRPPPARVVEAIVAAQRLRAGPSPDAMLEALGGGGAPGNRWQLAYVADKAAVVAARKGENPWWRRLAPWADGLYVDSLVSAIQRFDNENLDNENGVFEILGSDVFQTTVRGPFRWSKRAICAFRPDVATFKVGPFETAQDLEDPVPFDDVPFRDLPFFKFLLVDDAVAVAQGRSGSVALWTRVPREAAA